MKIVIFIVENLFDLASQEGIQNLTAYLFIPQFFKIDAFCD